MKTIEEKAKAYDEAIKRAQKVNLEMEYSSQKGVVEYIFPELKESEDEKISKALIHLVNSNKQLSFGIDNYDGIKWSDILAWLEKQGKQKPADKVEPKFKVGDVMRTLQEAANGLTDGMPVVVSIDNEYYRCTNEIIPIVNQDEYEYPPINRKQNAVKFEDDLEKEIANFAINGGSGDNTSTIGEIAHHFIEWQKKKQKPAWSEEDERIKQDIENLIRFALKDGSAVSPSAATTKEDAISWIQSLKDRIQPKQEWSEKDDQYLLVCKNALAKYQTTDKWDASVIYRWLVNKVKSLRPQLHWKPSDEQMEALESATENCAYSEYQDCLRQLIEQLKILKAL